MRTCGVDVRFFSSSIADINLDFFLQTCATDLPYDIITMASVTCGSLLYYIYIYIITIDIYYY